MRLHSEGWTRMSKPSHLLPLIALASTLGASVAVHAQETQQVSAPSSAAKKEKPAANTRKVWTNENLVFHRPESVVSGSPQNDSGAANAVTSSGKPASTAWQSRIKLPDTVEQADKMISIWTVDASDQEKAVARVQKELDEASDDQKPFKQRALEQYRADLDATRRELKALQDRRQELANKRSGGKQAGTPPGS